MLLIGGLYVGASEETLRVEVVNSSLLTIGPRGPSTCLNVTVFSCLGIGGGREEVSFLYSSSNLFFLRSIASSKDSSVEGVLLRELLGIRGEDPLDRLALRNC